MTETLWIAIVARMAMGAFDTVFHHEAAERLAWRPSRAAGLPAPLRAVTSLDRIADELSRWGQRVLPRAAVESGFLFSHPSLDGALAAIVDGAVPGAAAAVAREAAIVPADAT